MKTAVSIPDHLYEEADCYAAEHEISRSKLYSLALAEYLNRYSDDQITTQMNKVLSEVGEEDDTWTRITTEQVFRHSEW